MTAKQFWKWFETNKNQYKNYISVKKVDPLMGTDERLKTLSKQLNRYREGISFSIEPYSDHGRELIIAGNLGQFEDVSQLIGAAPKIKGWKFTQTPHFDFITEGLGFDFTFEFAGLIFDPTSMWFLPVTYETRANSLGIIVGFEHFEPSNKEELFMFTRLMIALCLGQELAEKNMRFGVERLPENPAQDGYIKLAELRRYIQRRKNAARRRQGQLAD